MIYTFKIMIYTLYKYWYTQLSKTDIHIIMGCRCYIYLVNHQIDHNLWTTYPCCAVKFAGRSTSCVGHNALHKYSFYRTNPSQRGCIVSDSARRLDSRWTHCLLFCNLIIMIYIVWNWIRIVVIVLRWAIYIVGSIIW